MRENDFAMWDREQQHMGGWGELFGTVQVSCRCTRVAVEIVPEFDSLINRASMNGSKESYGLNVMAHNYYLKEAKKKTQNKNTNLKLREMPSARTHNTPNACTPKLRSNNQMSRNWPASKSSDSSIKDRILAAQKEAVDEYVGLQKGLDEMIEQRSDGTLYYLDRIWVPLMDWYSWHGMKKDIAEYKWEGLAMDFVTKLPRTSSGQDIIWVIVDRLTKSAYFLPMFWQLMQEELGTCLDMSTSYHPQTDGQHERTIQTLKDMLRAYVLDFGGSWDVHLPLVELSYNNSYHSSVRCASFEALYGRKCRSPIMWDEVGEGQLIGPELVQETNKKISHIKDRLKAACYREKSYADKKRKPLEFSVGDYVLLKVSPWKGVVRFGKKGKLAPRFVRPSEINEKVGPVAYRLDLPEELNGVHDTFYVSNLKKFLADPTQVPLDEIQFYSKLNFMEEHVEILESEFKKLKRSRISIVKARWNSKRGPEFM
nr:putative reverse transcriptase domain-containing protein [Tanacetum cinerariifolium]